MEGCEWSVRVCGCEDGKRAKREKGSRRREEDGVERRKRELVTWGLDICVYVRVNMVEGVGMGMMMGGDVDSGKYK